MDSRRSDGRGGYDLKRSRFSAIDSAEEPSLGDSQATDLRCSFTLASGGLITFHVLHNVNGTKTLGGTDYVDSASVTKVKINGGKPVTGLGPYAFGITINGTGVVAWQISKKGVKAVAYELDGPVLDNMVAIAKLVRPA